MTFLVRIADQLLNRPLLITPDKAQTIMSVLSGRIGIRDIEANRFEGTDLARDESGIVRGAKPYRVSGGVAIITITGSLVNRGAWVGASSGLTSYEGIQHQLKTALADSDVHAVILDLHTPGGQAVGAFETAAMVRKLAAAKPTVALVAGMAASAGYAIASGATEIVTTETGISGSIGVLLLHADMSRQLDADGITPTLIFAGAHKVDGNPFEPLSTEVRAELQTEVNALYDLFVKTVATGRGDRLDEAAARSTEAKAFMGAEAVARGVADRVGTFEDLLAELSTRAPKGAPSNVQQRGTRMDTTQGAPAAEAGTFTQADMDRAVSEAAARATAAEAARLAGIDANFAGLSLPGLDKMQADHKADLTMTPEKSAVVVLAAVKAAPKDVEKGLEALNKATDGVTSTVSTTGAAVPAPVATTEEGWKAEYAASAELRGDYPTEASYVATKKREAMKSAA